VPTRKVSPLDGGLPPRRRGTRLRPDCALGADPAHHLPPTQVPCRRRFHPRQARRVGTAPSCLQRSTPRPGHAGSIAELPLPAVSNRIHLVEKLELVGGARCDQRAWSRGLDDWRDCRGLNWRAEPPPPALLSRPTLPGQRVPTLRRSSASSGRPDSILTWHPTPRSARRRSAGVGPRTYLRPCPGCRWTAPSAEYASRSI
jgi:hypothetical protein